METILKEFESDLECPLCMDTLENPIVTACGHYYCKSCFQSLPISCDCEDGGGCSHRPEYSSQGVLVARVEGTPALPRTTILPLSFCFIYHHCCHCQTKWHIECSICRHRLVVDSKIREMYTDVMTDPRHRLVKNILLAKTVGCTSPDCSWEGEYGIRDAHLKECPENIIMCDLCETSHKRKDVFSDICRSGAEILEARDRQELENQAQTRQRNRNRNSRRQRQRRRRAAEERQATRETEEQSPPPPPPPANHVYIFCYPKN